MSDQKRSRFPARLNFGAPPISSASSVTPVRAGAPVQGGQAGVSRQAQPPAALPPVPAVAVPVVQVGDKSSARQHMLHVLAQQGIQDVEVLRAMGKVERHRFVDPALQGQAYADTSLPIGLAQTISKPSVVARMLSLLRAGREGRLGRVLEIGTGGGYQAAVISQLADEVYSMERLRAMHERARENLRTLRIPNIHLLVGDGILGYPSGAPYAAIIAAAGGERVPDAWLDQLAVGGRLVAPVVTGPGEQSLVVVDRTSSGYTQHLLEGVMFVPLKSGVS